MKNTMSFVLKLVGLVLALTGLICLVVYYWDSIIGFFSRKNSECDCCCDDCCEDFDDDLLYEFEEGV